jgi:hypothetical protein
VSTIEEETAVRTVPCCASNNNTVRVPNCVDLWGRFLDDGSSSRFDTLREVLGLIVQRRFAQGSDNDGTDSDAKLRFFQKNPSTKPKFAP